jgi:hypothetical protein
MIEPREMHLQQEAIISLGHILGIMTDQMSMSEKSIWDIEHLYDLDARIAEHIDGESITLGIDDVALLLQGMAFTEVMSADFPWIEMVRWTSDFVTSELRQYWSEDQWREFMAQ